MNFLKDYWNRKKLEHDNNKVILHKKDGSIIYYPEIPGLNIVIIGKNNLIELYEPIGNWKNSNIIIRGYGATFSKQSTNDFSSNIWFELYDKSKIILGKNVSFYGGTISIDVSTSLIVQNDCLFSDNFYLRTGDGHTILDLVKDKPINKPQNIFIDERVWCCNSVSILKGAMIASDTVVAHRSVVNKAFTQSNCILAGIPANIVKENIIWNKMPYNKYVFLKENEQCQ